MSFAHPHPTAAGRPAGAAIPGTTASGATPPGATAPARTAPLSPAPAALLLVLVLGAAGWACGEPATPGEPAPHRSGTPAGAEAEAAGGAAAGDRSETTGTTAAAPAAAPEVPEAGGEVRENPVSPSPVQRPGGTWSSADPAAHGLDPDLVARGVREIAAQGGVRTLLVVAGGELVVEESWGGASTRRPTNVKSASKSLLSALVGIDLEAGLLPALDAPLERLLPDLEMRDDVAAVTLRNLLTMTSGLESTSGPGYGAWVSADDWTRAALGQPRVAPRGEEFVYSTGNSHVLAAVLEEAAGADLLDHARRRLLDPLGIGSVTWQSSPEGVRFGGNNLSTSPRDLARFGLLYLQEGRWGERQVVPAEWVRESTRHHVDTTPEWADRYGDYGYLWWLPPGEGEESHGGAYAAVGYGGQFVYVAPEAGVVVVLTSTLEGKGTAWDRRVLGIFRDHFAGAAR